jgi:hypothetical protein
MAVSANNPSAEHTEDEQSRNHAKGETFLFGELVQHGLRQTGERDGWRGEVKPRLHHPRAEIWPGTLKADATETLGKRSSEGWQNDGTWVRSKCHPVAVPAQSHIRGGASLQPK